LLYWPVSRSLTTSAKLAVSVLAEVIEHDVDGKCLTIAGGTSPAKSEGSPIRIAMTICPPVDTLMAWAAPFRSRMRKPAMSAGS
jgi:hypothetical protein